MVLNKMKIFLLIFFSIISFSAKAESILLVRGLDQIFFRGMDALGEELKKHGHKVEVSSPFAASFDNKSYDVLIGNSQGAILVLYRKQKVKPKIIISIDPPSRYPYAAPKSIPTYNIYGPGNSPGGGIVKNAINIPIKLNHLTMSYSEITFREVNQILIDKQITLIW